ncbi:MAG: PIG-L family deacetylase [Candidatus Omnitrophica bacterium]|nr:PIG-L family deacetylase [Candidatus Omnitrophota bacterium]
MTTLLKQKWAEIIFFACYLLFATSYSLAQEFKRIEFSKGDRILILAPHPDDETIGTGGVIQKAIKGQAEIKVVVFTNGDHNELAFIVYEKRVVFRKKEFLHLGELRRKETLQAMGLLGLKKEDIIFLGYPDRGTIEILTKYWGEVSPYKNLLTRISQVMCAECFSPNVPYVGESILEDLKKIILDFKPTKIFISHPVDTNPDHRGLYLFLQIALWELGKKIKIPEIYPYLIHIWGWPKPKGYRPELEINPPKKVRESEIDWFRVELSDEEVKKKYEAILLYRSQVKPYPIYLPTFARKNELFGDYKPIRLKRNENLIWQNFRVNQEEGFAGETLPEKNISNLAYGSDKDNFFIRLNLRRKIDKDFGISVYLLGYREGENFSQMPKLRLMIDIRGLHIKNMKHTLFIKDVNLKYENKKKTVVIKVPYSVLGDPDYILTSTSSRAHLLPFDETAWRIIKLD